MRLIALCYVIMWRTLCFLLKKAESSGKHSCVMCDLGLNQNWTRCPKSCALACAFGRGFPLKVLEGDDQQTSKYHPVVAPCFHVWSMAKIIQGCSGKYTSTIAPHTAARGETDSVGQYLDLTVVNSGQIRSFYCCCCYQCEILLDSEGPP